MIYISTSSIDEKNLLKNLERVHRNGFSNVELSGGLGYSSNIKDELLLLGKKFNQRYLFHNYFPPPLEPLVLNLGSLNNEIYEKTLSQLKASISLSADLGINKFSFHAGYYIDIKPDEIGRSLSESALFDREKSLKRFTNALRILKSWDETVKIYIENNVISHANYQAFQKNNPLMLTNHAEYEELKKEIDFNLLLDVGHLKVSTATLGLNFQDEMDRLMPSAEYIHISDNDGKSDMNLPLREGSELLRVIEKYDMKDKTVSLEVRGSDEELRISRDLLMKVCGNQEVKDGNAYKES